MHFAGKVREGSRKFCSAEDRSCGQGQLSSVESAKEIPGGAQASRLPLACRVSTERAA